MGLDLTDNVYIKIQAFPLPPLKAMISWNKYRIAYNISIVNINAIVFVSM